MTGGRPVLAPGDQVHFDDEQHQVHDERAGLRRPGRHRAANG